MKPHLSSGHVLWAWETHVYDKWREGLTVADIRRWLRDDHGLHVGAEAIRAVLWSYGVRDFTTRRHR